MLVTGLRPAGHGPARGMSRMMIYLYDSYQIAFVIL
jgi:hypothetical protein